MSDLSDRIIKRKLTPTLAIWLLAGISAILGLLPVVHVLAAALLIALLLCHDIVKAIYLKIFAWVAIFLVGVFMALYRPDDFSYFNSISVESLHEHGKPYQQFLNLGKFFGALIIFIWVMLGDIKRDIYLAIRRRNLMIALGSAVGVLSLAMLLLQLHFIPKFSHIAIIFLGINLVVTCFSEETFYRLVVQNPSEKAFANVWASRIFGIIVVSTFFTLTHFSNQPKVLAAMMIAGTLYAVTYAQTRSVTSAILAHFSVNALHFLLLPYPI